jgi:hypothetical protein
VEHRGGGACKRELATGRFVGVALTIRERNRGMASVGVPRLSRKDLSMSYTIRTFSLATALVMGLSSAQGAEREQVRMVINMIAGVKMPFPQNLRNNTARTERVDLDTNGATVACLRLDDKIRWCFEHIAPVGARAEMLRIRNEPVTGLLVGNLYHYVDDFDLDGSVDIGSTTRLEGQPHAPIGVVAQYFHRGTNRGSDFRGDYQKLYDDGIAVALRYLGE